MPEGHTIHCLARDLTAEQATCRACGSAVARLALAARTIYACETCQPRPRS
ncbi:MAG: hypothetical protein K8W52_17620 [Deltaproteobacteria bacterium]|nr:hypothetical protein [Deltaproteobacteria bacterium]